MQNLRFPRHRRVLRAGLRRIGAVVLLLTGAGLAQAQSSAACEQFKARLAARISGGPGTFTLEDVPADAPLPPGAKAVATCEGGARKILLIRTGRAAPAATEASDAATAPAPAATRVATEPKRATPPVEPAAAPTPAASLPAPRTLPGEARRPAPPREPEPPPAGPSVAPGLSTGASAGAPGATTIASDALEPAQPAGAFGDRAAAFVMRHGLWLLALLLPLAGLLWAWFAHRSAYDEAGLPRGPRLN
jgi:hypothetical protein